ncbi:MAG: PD-(D/E)XK nuclease family protein [Roseobacter sp.]
MFYPFEVADVRSHVQYRLTDTRLAELSLAPRPDVMAIGKTIAAYKEPVWAESFVNAPAETIAAISSALHDLIVATTDLCPPNVADLPDCRPKLHLSALIRLWDRQNGALPDGLATTRHVLELPHGEFLTALPVVEGSLDSNAPAAMRALYDRLLAEFGSVAPPPRSTRRKNDILGVLQSGLIAPNLRPVPQDTSIEVFGLRDPDACADFAAARSRALIESGVRARDIAVLTAGDPQDLATAFAAQGVPLSGLPEMRSTRDVVGETLLHILLAKRAPTPAMVLASLALSPLMPWAAQTGCDLAEDIMDGRFRGPSLDSTADYRNLWDDIRQPASSAPQLRVLLDKIFDPLPDATAMQTRAAPVFATLGADGPLDWDAILSASVVAPTKAGDPNRNLQGVSLWPAHETPWRACKHLIIVDFNDGNYPARPRPNAMFLDSEVEQIAALTAVQMRGRTENLSHSLALFERQLSAVSDSVTCLVAYRSLDGSRVPPAAGLSLVARAVDGMNNASDLVVDIAQLAPADWPVAHHPLAPLAPPAPAPKALSFGGRDLLSLRLDETGTALPQSPSRLETLLVSPLAWFLAELGAGDMSWGPETLDVMTKGNIAHHVFEHVFLPQTPLPDEDTLRAAIPPAFEDALRRNAPFLRAPTWELECTTLERDITTAALRWRSDLMALDANILGNETWLHGDPHGILIRGKADTILRLPDDKILIIDYKKSGTAGRRKRMEKGWDLQIGLYRDMLARATRLNDDGLDDVIGADIAIAYFLMNDGGLLSSGMTLSGAANARDMGPDIGVEANTLLVERIKDVGAGHIQLNTTDDHDFFVKQAGFPPYTLGASPIIAAFLHEANQ